MKKTTWMLGVVSVFGLMFTSCVQELAEGAGAESKQGVLTLSLKGKANFGPGTRAVNEADYNNTDQYTVIVTDKNGNEKLNCKGSELAYKMPLTMDIGSYSVKAYYGKESAASRDEFYVEGIAEGTIKSDHKEAVTVDCEPTCGRIMVEFASGMSEYFSEYYVTFSGTKALGKQPLMWGQRDVEPWYVRLDEHGETITFTITTVTKDEYINSSNGGQTAMKTGTFNLKRNKGYKMNISTFHYSPDEGSIDIQITIDESTNDKEVDIEVPVDWI